MKRHARAALALALLSVFPLSVASAGGLGGSLASMRRQYQIARQNDFTFLRTPAQVQEFVQEERLEPVESNDVLLVNKVSFPYARPAIAQFIERLAGQYYAAVGDRLVVTSLTRPTSRQPRNAHKLSVHPTGMAVDFRIPADASARKWLESTLLELEASGVLDATRERNPAHYHVAVFPSKYEEYVARLAKDTIQVTGTRLEASLDPEDSSVAAREREHEVTLPEEAAPVALVLAGFTSILGAGVLMRRRARR
jgi:uncharacterized protein DUF5715